MVELVTLEEAKAELIVEHNADDARISMLIKGCSASVLRFLEAAGYEGFYDGSTVTASAVPDNVKLAVLLYVSMLYDNDSVQEQERAANAVYLPNSVRMMLHQMRRPQLR